MSTTTLPHRPRFTPARIGSLIGAAAVGVVAFVAIGRFADVGHRPTPAARPASATAAVTLTAAITSYEQRTTSHPQDASAWTMLGSLYVRQAAASGDPTFYGLAATALDHAATLAPDAPATLAARGGLALAIHDFATADQLAAGVIAAAPYDAEAYSVGVDAAVELGHYDVAEARLQRLLDLKPNSSALSRTSYLRELNGDFAGALTTMQAAEQAAIAEPASRAVLAGFVGDLQLASGDTDAASASYARALAAAPHLLNAELGQARVAIAEGRLDAAATTLHELVARSPQPAVATLLSDLDTLTGDTTGAAEAIDLVRANDRLLQAAGVTIDLESAIFEADRGDPATALTYAQAAYAARHTVFTADAMGWALTRAGRAAEALPYVDEALALGTPTASLHVHAAAAAAATGDAARARSELTTAFAQSPWFALPLRPVATELADSLGVVVPTAWRP